MKRIALLSRVNVVVIHLLVPSVLLGLSLFYSLPLFLGEYTQHMRSIEAMHISNARFILQHYPHLNWHHLWYLGFPFHLNYLPLIPYLTALVSAISSVSIASSYRVLTAFAYVMAPVTFYFFAHRLMRSRIWALVSALAYSFFPSSYYYFPYGAGLAQKIQGYPPVRLINLTFFGEGPHTIGLAIMPLAALFFLEVIENPRPRNYILVAVSIAAVALANAVALFALAIILAVLLLVKVFGGRAHTHAPSLNSLWRAFICFLLAYGLVAFKYDLPFIRASFFFGWYAKDRVISSWWILMLFFMIGIIFLVMFAKSRGEAWTIGLAWVTIFGGVILSFQLFGLMILPRPHRYFPELDMGIALLIGLATRSISRGKGLKRFLVITVIIVIALNSVLSLRAGWSIAEPNENITDTVEYRIANHLDTLVLRGERVYATGTTAFWLNVFTDIPQVRGGYDAASTNSWWAYVMYQVNTGEDPDLSIQWLKSLNVRYVVVDFPNSSTYYKDYTHPFKFEGILQKAFQSGGVAVYEIPMSNFAWVQLVNSEDAIKQKPIEGILDREGLANYLKMVENPPANGIIDYVVQTPGEIRLKVVGCSGRESLLVKSTFDPRWSAVIDGVEAPIKKIGPDFILVQLSRTGDFEVSLIARPLLGQRIGEWITGATVIVLLVLIAVFHSSSARRSIGRPLRRALYGPMVSNVKSQRHARLYVPSRVPPHVAEDYKTAASLFTFNPKASVALSRSCLQKVLREAGGTTAVDLKGEIEEISPKLPKYLQEYLEAHPIKSESTEEIEVEHYEAQLNLKILDALFDFYYEGKKV